MMDFLNWRLFQYQGKMSFVLLVTLVGFDRVIHFCLYQRNDTVGEISSLKGVNLPSKESGNENSIPTLFKHDEVALQFECDSWLFRFGMEAEVDQVYVSFTRSSHDIRLRGNLSWIKFLRACANWLNNYFKLIPDRGLYGGYVVWIICICSLHALQKEESMSSTKRLDLQNFGEKEIPIYSGGIFLYLYYIILFEIWHFFRAVKEYLKGSANPIQVIAKIENTEGSFLCSDCVGLTNLDTILEECDGVLVARGDLGVEIGFYFIFNMVLIKLLLYNKSLFQERLLLEKCEPFSVYVEFSLQLLLLICLIAWLTNLVQLVQKFLILHILFLMALELCCWLEKLPK